MMMPSIVKAARILFLTSARKATRMIIKSVICLLFVFVVFVNQRQILQLFRRVALIRHWIIALNLSVFENHDALRVLRDVWFVRDEHERDAAFAVQTLEDLH